MFFFQKYLQIIYKASTICQELKVYFKYHHPRIRSEL